MPTSLNDMKYHGLSRTNSHGSSLDCDDEAGRSLVQCTLGSPGEIPELNVDILTESSTPFETRAWLTNHRFIGSTQAFGNFSGSDLLRSSRDDLIQICGVADGIRLYNALHAERSPARLTLYIKRMSEQQYNAVYLRNCQVGELKKKIGQLLQDGGMGLAGDIYVAGPSGIRIRLTDEVVQNFKNDSTFRLEPVEGGMILILT